MEEGMMDLPEEIRARFELEKVDLRTYSPLGLAFIGDGIYDLIIRTLVMEKGNRPANELNRRKVKYVNAAAQAEISDVIQEILTEEEVSVFRRGRNAKSYTSAKNQSVGDYRKATGLEALCGYLYLSGNTGRVMDLVEYGIKHSRFDKTKQIK